MSDDSSPDKKSNPSNFEDSADDKKVDQLEKELGKADEKIERMEEKIEEQEKITTSLKISYLSVSYKLSIP